MYKNNSNTYCNSSGSTSCSSSSSSSSKRNVKNKCNSSSGKDLTNHIIERSKKEKEISVHVERVESEGENSTSFTSLTPSKSMRSSDEVKYSDSDSNSGVEMWTRDDGDSSSHHSGQNDSAGSRQSQITNKQYSGKRKCSIRSDDNGDTNTNNIQNKKTGNQMNTPIVQTCLNQTGDTYSTHSSRNTPNNACVQSSSSSSAESANQKLNKKHSAMSDVFSPRSVCLIDKKFPEKSPQVSKKLIFEGASKQQKMHNGSESKIFPKDLENGCRSVNFTNSSLFLIFQYHINKSFHLGRVSSGRWECSFDFLSSCSEYYSYSYPH